MKKQNAHDIFSILRYITPSNVGGRKGRLIYRNRSKSVKRAALHFERDIWHELLKSESGSVEEKALAEELLQVSMAFESSLLQEGSKMHDQERTAMITKSFTDHSVELYGTQNANETLETMSHDMHDFKQALVIGGKVRGLAIELMKEYQRLGVSADDDYDSVGQGSRLTPGDQEFRETAMKVFHPIYEVIELDKVYSARQVKRLFSYLIKIYNQNDSRWAGWKSVYKVDGSLAVDVTSRSVLVGRKRSPALGLELAATLAHETVHAMRSVRATNYSNRDLAVGLNGYLAFEEGLGCYIEYILTRKVPDKIVNRQITASLALGQLGALYDRNTIFELLAKRLRVKMAVQGTYNTKLYDIKRRELKTLVVDRFFRGGEGVGSVHPVFTKDVVYSQGFTLAKHYIRSQLAKGVCSNELFDFLLCAKFDPLNDRHIATLRTEGIYPPSF